MHPNVTKPFLCNICGKRYTTAGSRGRHTQVHFTSFTCKICGKQYTRVAALKKHLKIPHVVNQRGRGNITPARPSSRHLNDRDTQTALNNMVQIKTFHAYNRRDRYD